MAEAALESLSKEECLELLKGAKYGRVTVVTGEGRPQIFPVNYEVRNGTIVFVTGSAVVQARAPLGHVAFEVDHVDLSSHEGWDVVVSGVGAEITDAVDDRSVLARSHRLDVWAPGMKEHWISIVKPRFSGRRLYVPTPAPTFY